MPLLLFAAFIVVPLVELAVIARVGSAIGLPWTLLLLLAMSVIGAWLVRREGRRAWRSFRQALSDGRWPGDEVVQGALVLVGGALLVTPGFVTDAVGLLLVLPLSRRLTAGLIRRRLTPGQRQVYRTRRGPRGPAGRGGATTPPSTGARPGGEVLDVEVVAVERSEPDPG